jgi:inorganic pyrophosphatase
MMLSRQFLAIVLSSCALAAQDQERAPNVLPPSAAAQLAKSLAAAAAHSQHIWRDTPPMNSDGTVNGYIEISRGDRRKWELDMAANARAIDRVMPEDVGGYPVNYGFVPQTVSYDGDPFDALVLGPPIPGGELVRGVIVGLMHMEDEKGLDSKVVLSPVGRDGGPLYDLSSSARENTTEYFRKYRMGEPGKFSRVPGWGSIAEGRSYLNTTHAFFKECRRAGGAPCQILQ